MGTPDDRFRSMIEHSADAFFTADLEGRLQWVSPAIRKITGEPASQLLGRDVDEFVIPEDREQLLQAFRRAREGCDVMFHGRVVHETASPRWVAATGAPLRDPNGEIVAIVGVIRDIHDLVETRLEAEQSKHRLQATIDSLMDPCIVLAAVRDGEGRIVDFRYLEANEAACRQFHPDRPQLIGTTIREAMPPFVAAQLVDLFTPVVEHGTPLVLDNFCFTLPDGERDDRRFDLRAVKVGDGVSHIWRDITDRHHTQEHLEHLATHDPLTGLANRAALVDDLERALVAAQRSGRPTAVLMFDLDRFKQVNDAYGHGVGDQLLIAVARRLDRIVRAGDLSARLGGDEFVVVMRDLDEPREALRVGNRIVDEFRVPVEASGHELRTTASVGVAIGHGDIGAAQLLAEADEAMYRAKRSGRDRVELYNDDLRQAAHARLALEAQLRPALDLGELAVHYQPEVDLRSGRICAVEALLRWHHPSGELFPAERFIDVAEEIGVIVDSGNWAMREACAQVALWRAERPDHRVILRVNLSPQQLAETGLVPSFERALLDSGLPASMVSVELSEAALMQPNSTVVGNLDGLRALGMHLVIDRFGTGYAALAQLRDRRVDMVKIDRSFVRDITDNDYSRRLVRGIVALAGEIDVHVSAEGVETAEQATILRSLGVNVAQGYLFAPALTATELRERLDEEFTVSR